MNLTFTPMGRLEIDDARIIFRNFQGREGEYNKNGERNFSVSIGGGTLDDGHSIKDATAEEMADALMKDVNRFGVSWNVKIKAPTEEGDYPRIHLPVKVNFNEMGPRIYLISGHNRVDLTEETVGMLDQIEIARVDLDIAPSDKVVNGKPYRTAYLRSMCVVQEVDRFAARFAEEEYPEE